VKEKRAGLDPFMNEYSVDETAAFEQLCELPDTQVNQLIDVLVIEKLTAHLRRPTALIDPLVERLQVDLRKSWTPDATWLSGYQKAQLGHLLGLLKGPVYSPTHETRKKSELVQSLAVLFADASDGRLDNKQLAERVNNWTPSNICETPAGVEAESETATAPCEKRIVP
jgi:hypothetical protein